MAGHAERPAPGEVVGAQQLPTAISQFPRRVVRTICVEVAAIFTPRLFGSYELGFGLWELGVVRRPPRPVIGSAATGRPMTIDDLIGAVRVTDPQLSPDGGRVAFVRTTTDLKSGQAQRGHLGRAADGSAAPKELIGGETSETSPRFSPDGRRLAFLSTRDGGSQVYIAEADGTNVEEADGARDGRAASARVLRRRIEDRVRVGRLPRMPRRGVQRAEERGGREEPGQGPPADAAALPALGRMAREHPSPRVRGGRRRAGAAEADRRHARRLRFAAGATGRRRDRVRSGRPRDRVRLEPRRRRSRGVDDESRRVDRAGRRAARRRRSRATPRPTCSRCFHRTAARCSCARSGVRASRPIDGTWTCTIDRAARSARCSRRPTSRSETIR